HAGSADPDEVHPRPGRDHPRTSWGDAWARRDTRATTRSAASGRPWLRAAAASVSSRPGRSKSAAISPARTSPVSWASGTSTAPPAATRLLALRAWWSSAAYGYGTRMAGRPHAVISASALAPQRLTTASAHAYAAPIRSR